MSTVDIRIRATGAREVAQTLRRLAIVTRSLVKRLRYGGKPRPGQWSDRARIRRAARLQKAAERRRAAWLQDIPRLARGNRRARRASERGRLIYMSYIRGLAPLPGEHTQALRARVVEHMRALPRTDARATEGAES